MVGAMCSTPKGFANAWHILPMLHDGLRAMANERDVARVGDRRMRQEIPGIEKTRAIKVHVEHQRAYTIAFYPAVLAGFRGHITFRQDPVVFRPSPRSMDPGI